MAKELTNSQKDELIEQYVELITDSMDVKTLEQFVRDFFTDEQWDLIDYALNEYQDHDDSTEKCKETLNVIGDLFRSSY